MIMQLPTTLVRSNSSGTSSGCSSSDVDPTEDCRAGAAPVHATASAQPRQRRRARGHGTTKQPVVFFSGKCFAAAGGKDPDASASAEDDDLGALRRGSSDGADVRDLALPAQVDDAELDGLLSRLKSLPLMGADTMGGSNVNSSSIKRTSADAAAAAGIGAAPPPSPPPPMLQVPLQTLLPGAAAWQRRAAATTTPAAAATAAHASAGQSSPQRVAAVVRVVDLRGSSGSGGGASEALTQGGRVDKAWQTAAAASVSARADDSGTESDSSAEDWAAFRAGRRVPAA
jgi:hypothetical protein